MHKSLPKLDLNITNRCNFRCIHCAFDSGCERMRELSVRHLETILQDTKDLGGERIDVTGGEPTVRKDLPDIIRTAKSLDHKIELVTNGSLLTRDRLLELIGLGLDSIAISLDGSTYETHSSIRKVSEETYRKVHETIRSALSLGLRTKINTVAFTSNMDGIPKITEFCIENGVYEHGIYYFTPIGRGRAQDLSIEPVAWLDFLRKNVVPYGSKIKLSVEVPLLEKGARTEGKGCILEEDPYHLQILPDGNVYPCAILASYRLPWADLHERSIKDIWKDERGWDAYAKQVRARVFEKNCGSCVDFRSFGIRDYDTKIYSFICPLRKFLVGEVA